MDSVVFDMGGVVLDWDPAALLTRYYADPARRTQLRAALFEHPDWLDLDRGTRDEADVLARLAGRTGRPPAELAGLLEACRESLTPKLETLTLIERLHARGVPLYVLSNMGSATYEHLRRRHDWWRLFRGVVISGLVQKLKPERELFEHLLAAHGLCAERTIFVDDHRPNIDAAAALGLRTVWFRDPRQCEHDLEALLGAAGAAS